MSKGRGGSPPEAYLYLEDGDAVFRIRLQLPRYLIGSGAENDVRIRDPRVAKRHCMITYAGGFYSIAARKRAVRVNGSLVAGSQRLSHGTVIDLAGNLITFVQVPRTSTQTLQLGIRTQVQAPWFLVLNRPNIMVGRGGDCDLRIDDLTLDLNQLKIENFGPNLIFVHSISEDRNTALNGEVLRTRARLRDGDRLEAGASELVVRLLHRELPAIDEPLEWGRQAGARLAPVAAPAPTAVAAPATLTPQAAASGRASRQGRRRLPVPATSTSTPAPEDVGDVTLTDPRELDPAIGEDTMDINELEELAARVAGISGDETVDEQAHLSTLLLKASELDKVRAQLAARATTTEQDMAALPPGSDLADGKPKQATAPRTRGTAVLPTVSPNKRIKASARVRSQRNEVPAKDVQESKTQTDLPQVAKPARSARLPPPPVAPPRPKKAEIKRRRDSDGHRKGANPRLEPARLPPKPSAAPAYYMPGQGRSETGGGTRDDKGGTMTDVPVVGARPAGAASDAYYVPADTRADEARRRSRTDYHSESEERMEEARRRLLGDQRRSPAPSDARSAGRQTGKNGPMNTDFDE